MNNRLEPYFRMMEEQQETRPDTEIQEYQDGGSYWIDALIIGFSCVCLFVTSLLGRLVANL